MREIKAEADILKGAVRIATVETAAMSVITSIVAVMTHGIAGTETQKNGEAVITKSQDGVRIPGRAAHTMTIDSAAILHLWCVTAADAKDTNQQNARRIPMSRAKQSTHAAIRQLLAKECHKRAAAGVVSAETHNTPNRDLTAPPGGPKIRRIILRRTSGAQYL
jgi:hypothetical protein